MPLQRLRPGRQLAENRIADPRLGEAHIADADFGRPLRPARTAERIGEELMAKAHAQIGAPQFSDPVPDGAFFGRQPGMLLDIPHVHRDRP